MCLGTILDTVYTQNIIKQYYGPIFRWRRLLKGVHNCLSKCPLGKRTTFFINFKHENHCNSFKNGLNYDMTKQTLTYLKKHCDAGNLFCEYVLSFKYINKYNNKKYSPCVTLR